ncbi:hypothetical protein O0I10_011682 [Lichtheimia ornata]|uniref:Antiviral helicase n=1 Tax=Lichtheimia ornata TaxID=688661 RepID=A0AAD7UT09_9FUNG|nr:uncharacterized protein O0I10_011682 [Lichtheimia ornata]KAJ8652675.1 hypothetical protein O0I10_011682 [Lichtheimia ornata]
MFGGDDERNIDIFGVFNGGGAATADDLDDAMEEEETEVANEQLVEDTKNRAQQVTQSDALPPSGTVASNKRSYDTDVVMAESSKRYRPEEQQPIVADTFEEQTSREVANIAGLQGGTSTPADKQITLRHQVRHQVAVPADYDYTPISQHVRSKDPARTYRFTLDPFQSTSISCIERNESVLVSAHTSAGKTVIAEYAIAQCLKNKQRVIYTSPIKALSNQKYREFTEVFGDVGLLTGDVSINPQASCLVMTTEILRSMLYRGSEIMREVAWVIFDEIHYMRDSERGVVWEESIILLPNAVRYVFLSATIPNARQFAEWICKIHNQPCHVVYTDFRPTPLQHYLFPAGGDGIHLVVDEKGRFKEDNFRRALASISDKQNVKSKGRQSNKQGSGNGGTDGPSDIYRIVKMIIMKAYHPVIVFSFSKRECEANAMQMSKLDLNDASERDMVDEVFENALASLSKDDRTLPQIQQLHPLLRRGIGVHHGGLLPIMKEIIEVLFQEGLVKVLFATETFSIGLNMPAKTVVFTQVSKFDGKESRWLSSGEYIQMSGRAGRRGLDERGVVIMMVGQELDPHVAKGMVMGESDPMNSAFHLSYNMVLNLLRVEGISPEYMLQRCFYTFQSDMSLPILEQELANAEEQKNAIKLDDEEDIASYYELRKQIDILAEGVREMMNDPVYCLQFMQPGRLVRVRHLDMEFGWGIIVGYRHKERKGSESTAEEYLLDVLLYCDKSSSLSKGAGGKAVGIKPALSEYNGTPLVVPVSLSSLDGISHVCLALPNRLKSPENRETAHKMILDVQNRFHNRIPLVDPIRNMNITDPRFKDLIEKIFTLESKLMTHQLNQNPDLPYLYDTYARKIGWIQKCKALKRKVGEARSIVQLEELKARKRVLRRLGFTSQGDVVDIKGRVACEITTGDELMLTEMIFQNVFNDLSVDQCVALLSCFVFDEKTDKKSKLQEELAEPLRLIQNTARQIGDIALECKMNIDVDAYVAKFNPGLMDVVYAWCRGATFAELCKSTEVYEGSLIRAFRRLEELLKEMVAASSSIGNTELESKFAEGIKKIHRDIIFAASLYI